MESDMKDLKQKLLDSHWPKCNEFAEEILKYNNDEAKEALIEALSQGKRHHVRTAAIKALAVFNDKSIVKHIEPLLNDPAYET